MPIRIEKRSNLPPLSVIAWLFAHRGAFLPLMPAYSPPLPRPTALGNLLIPISSRNSAETSSRPLSIWIPIPSAIRTMRWKFEMTAAVAMTPASPNDFCTASRVGVTSGDRATTASAYAINSLPYGTPVISSLGPFVMAPNSRSLSSLLSRSLCVCAVVQ